jgi:hypothetical protein
MIPHYLNFLKDVPTLISYALLDALTLKNWALDAPSKCHIKGFIVETIIKAQTNMKPCANNERIVLIKKKKKGKYTLPFYLFAF